MKLYTRPRPIYPHQLRPGDQVATFTKGGDLIRSETAYVDADLAKRVSWTVVHHAETQTVDNVPGVRIIHTLGQHDARSSFPVIAREVIEIDPWTYVRPEQEQAGKS